jgi:hypothetical protein
MLAVALTFVLEELKYKKEKDRLSLAKSKQ